MSVLWRADTPLTVDTDHAVRWEALTAGGADLQIVRERLGHAGLRATERYLHKPSGIASGGRDTRSLPGNQGTQ